jgi:putative flippase GtrA
MPYLTTVIRDQRIRFLIVGAWNTLAGYLIFVGVHILIGSKLGNMAVVAVAYALALPLSFLLQKLFVFSGDGAWLKQFGRFVVANSAVFIANLLFLPLFVKITGLDVLLSQALFVLASTVISYFAHKHFSFAG